MLKDKDRIFQNYIMIKVQMLNHLKKRGDWVDTKIIIEKVENGL